jgi:hypothetical protein
MVERIRRSKFYGFLAAIYLEFLAMFVHSAQDDETPDQEIATASHEPQAMVMPRNAYMQLTGLSASSGVAHLTELR